MAFTNPSYYFGYLLTRGARSPAQRITGFGDLGAGQRIDVVQNTDEESYVFETLLL
ncbi:hypothetical protein ABFA25_03525 [Mycobacterium lepromatosis]|nr:hypothetical protein [Mycobacterium lepromatosis]